jgi:hypothetical protein
MNIAPEICGKCVANYISIRDIPYTFQKDNKDTSIQITKNVNNPLTAYHKWLETNKNEISRNSVINNLEKHNKSINPKSSKIPSITENKTDEHDESENTPLTSEDIYLSQQFILIVERSKKEDMVFKLLINMNWCDKDVKIMSVDRIKPINSKLCKLLPFMFKMADRLYNVIQHNTESLNDLEEESKYDFLFHIIFKGRQFYLNCISDPGFCTYLIPDGYQKTMQLILEINKYHSIEDLQNFN